MDFIDQIKTLSARIQKQLEFIQTEEAAKQAFVIPFINILGYDVFDPTEVVPEYIADVGIKKGEKVDYAILKNNEPIMLFECKDCKTDLDIKHASQLFRYFTTTKARIGVLTNGVIYKFFTDLEKPNTMDEKPFLEINLLDIQEPLIQELKKFSKSIFDINQMLNSASELKYSKEIKNFLAAQLINPSDDFVKILAKQVYSGTIWQNVLDQFRGITKRAFNQFINEEFNARLKSVLNNDSTDTADINTPQSATTIETEEVKKPDIVTTDEEIESYLIIKAIMREIVNVKRIAHRDTMSYFNILLDDNKFKPICRMYLNTSKKYIALFDNSERKEEKQPINTIDDIYIYSERLKATVLSYDKKLSFDTQIA
jgi:hypothetical protein